MSRKTRKQKQKRGGASKMGAKLGWFNFSISKPSLIDGRTCYQLGPIKWCTRKK
jgi:hypothetical protein